MMPEAIFQELIQQFIFIAYPVPLLVWAMIHIKILIMVDEINNARDPEIITMHDLTFVGTHEKGIINVLFLFGYAYMYLVLYN